MSAVYQLPVIEQCWDWAAAGLGLRQSMFFWNAGTQEGHAFCFLPLPVQTGLPVHVNAFFELSSNRRDIWWVLQLMLSSMLAWPGVTMMSA